MCSSNFMNEMEAAGKRLRGALQTLVSITTHRLYGDSYLESAACLSMRALRCSFSCWTFVRFSSNLTFLSFWGEKKQNGIRTVEDKLFPSAAHLTSFSSSINFFSCWWSCWFLISRTTLRLSNSCSRYSVWESLCGEKPRESGDQGFR